MPIYEHECPHCGHKTETRLPYEEDDIKQVCPICSKDMVKVFSTYNFSGNFVP